MSETQKQRKRRENAELWAGIYAAMGKGVGKRLTNDAARINRAVEKRKRAQFARIR